MIATRHLVLACTCIWLTATALPAAGETPEKTLMRTRGVSEDLADELKSQVTALLGED